MATISYIMKNREKMFPEIKDFSNPQDHLRNMKLLDMSYGQIFWFHPHSYAFFHFALPGVSLLNFSLFATYFFVNSGFGFLSGLLSVLAIISLISSIKAIAKYKYVKDRNMYDFFMRDYYVEGDKV